MPPPARPRVALKLEKGGIYRIRVTGTDRFGQTITRETAVEVSDNDDANKLRLFADEATLKVGQDAKVRLHSRLDKGLALLTYEGETILRYQIVDLHKDYNDIAFKVGHDLFPNFRLAAAAIDGRDLRATSKEFTVERELKVVVKPLKEAFLPGEDGKVEITVTDQIGQPVEAELSLALVNEALFAVCPDTDHADPRLLPEGRAPSRRVPHRRHLRVPLRRHHPPGRQGRLTDEKSRLARGEDEGKALDAVREEMSRSFARSPQTVPARSLPAAAAVYGYAGHVRRGGRSWPNQGSLAAGPSALNARLRTTSR